MDSNSVNYAGKALTMKTTGRLKILLMLALSIGIAGSAYGKNITYTADATSEADWKTHFVALVKVAEVGPDARNPEIDLRVVDVIGERMPITGCRVRWAGLRIEGQSLRLEPKIKAGESFILWLHMKWGKPFLLTKVEDVKNDAMLKAVRQIGAIRRGSEGALSTAIQKGCLAPNPTTALYCMRRVKDEKNLAANAGVLYMLQKRRDREAEDVRVRIMANNLLVQAGRITKDEAYVWAKAAFADSKGIKWPELRQFGEVLLDSPERKKETVDFILDQMAKNPENVDVVTSASIVFMDRRAFNYDMPTDAVSLHTLDACFAMLHHAQPLLRGAAANNLFGLWNGTRDMPSREALRKKVQAALERRSAIEKDTDTKRIVDWQLKRTRGSK